MAGSVLPGSYDQSLRVDPCVSKYGKIIEEEMTASSSNAVRSRIQPFLNKKEAHNEPSDNRSASEEQATETAPVTEYLSSVEADIIEPGQETDLSQPIPHYFISSSHNTYLTGNQLYSEASVDGYMKVLKAGCRCVEIDVWNGRGPDDQSWGEEVLSIHDRLKGKETGTDQSADATEHAHRGLREKLGIKKTPTKPKQSHNRTPDVSKETAKTSDTVSAEAQLEPRVLHGHTLTREVPFRQVCEAIRATAFTSSALPLIVSLEVHCNLEQQQKMVDIMREVWSDHLLDCTKSATGHEPEYTAAPLPSPNDLRNKILIKVKYTPPEKAVKSHEKGANEHSDVSEMSEAEENPSEVEQPGQETPAKKKTMLDDLSLLGVYTRAFHFKSFDQKEARLPTHVFALSEKKLVNAIEKHSSLLTDHNKSYFMRAYPKGVRVTSSNLNPIPLWRHGVQMVALNWQSVDKSTMLNEGMFGGTRGWILKPESYREEAKAEVKEIASETDQNPTAAAGAVTEPSSSHSRGPSLTTTSTPTNAKPQTKRHLDLTMQVYAAQDLPLPEGVDAKALRPYVRCVLHTEALPSQRFGQSPDSSRSPSPQQSESKKLISDLTKEKHVAREKAGEVFHKISGRGRSPSPRASQDEAPVTQAKSMCKARTATRKGANVDFEGEALRFDNIPVDLEAEYMTFIRIKIVHDIPLARNELAGWACTRLGRLREGWGFWHLKDSVGNDTPGRLLVKVSYTLRSTDP